MALPQNTHVYMETVETSKNKEKKSDKDGSTRILCEYGGKLPKRTLVLCCLLYTSTKACRIVWIRDSLNIHSHLDLEYAIRRLEKDQPDSLTFLGKVGVGISEERLENGQLDAYDRVFLVLDDEENYQGEVEQLSLIHI